jgi:hypothetical protein
LGGTFVFFSLFLKTDAAFTSELIILPKLLDLFVSCRER